MQTKLSVINRMDETVDLSNCYSVKEVAKMFRKTERTVYSWIKKKKITSIQPFKEHYIPKQFVDQMLQIK